MPLAAPKLAKLIEDSQDDIERVRQYVTEIFGHYRDAESVILGCSHYSYISGLISEVYDGKVKIYDGAEGAARRLKYCLELSGLTAKKGECTPSIKFLSTYKK